MKGAIYLFQLSGAHVSAFQEVATTSFTERALEHLRAVLTEAAAPFTDEQVRQQVRNCMSRGAEYDLTTEQQIMHFVDATFLAGEDFELAPEFEYVREVLTDSDLDADSKATFALAAAQSSR